MGYPLALALRYLGSKKRAFVSVGTMFSTLGVALGVAALAIVMSVTGGFKEQFREKVLGVNAHVLVLKYASDFREYRDVMAKAAEIPGVTAVAPFIINPMMVTHGPRTATGVLLKGVDPELLPKVLDLPKQIVKGSIDGLRKPGAQPPPPPLVGKRGASGMSNDPAGFGDPTATWPTGTAAKDAAALGTSANSPEQAAPVATLVPSELPRTNVQDEPNLPRLTDPLAEGRTPSVITPADPTPAPAGSPSAGAAATPVDGYASELPSDDELPENIDPDPCKSQLVVASLPGIVIGGALAKQLALKLGDCVQITSPTVGMMFGSSASRAPIVKQFRVTAIFEAGFDQYDAKLVYTDIYEAEAFYGQGDSVTGVEMRVRDIHRAGEIALELDRKLKNPIYHTMDWQELNRGLFTALLIQQFGLSFVFTLIIIVAGFTVIATLIMVVLEKRREIALLKAIGATDSAILRVFLYQGGITGVVGTLLGLAVGAGGCKALDAYRFPLDPKVYFISHLPVSIRPTEFLITGGIAVVICLLATVMPSLYAAWLRPADGLRND
jgi:lipoprotein-releasing system permease protein